MKVKVVSKTGKGLLIEGEADWYNRAKNASFEDFKSLQRGDDVELTENGHWVTAFKKNGSSPSQPSQPSGGPSKSSAPSSGNFAGSRDPLVIERTEVLRIAFDKPFMKLVESMDWSQAVDECEKLASRLYDTANNGFAKKGETPNG